MSYKKIVIAILFVGWIFQSAQAEDWTSLGKDPTRTRSTSETLASSLTEAWKYPGQSEIVSSPAIADGIIVFGSRDNYVRAIKESDGSLVWSFLSGDEIYGSPALVNGRVYIPSADGKIYCLRLLDGSLVWNYWTGGSEFSSPVITNNTLYMGSGFPNKKVMAVNALNKQLVWEKIVEQIVYSSPAIADNKVFIGCDSGRYYALDQDNGSEIWSYSTGGDVLLSSPLVINDSVYLLPGGANANFYRVDIDQADWGTNWQIPLNDPSSPTGSTILGIKLATSSPMKLGGLVSFIVRFDYAIDSNADTLADQYVLNEYVIAIDPGTQSLKWQKAFGTRITSDQNKVPALGLCPTPLAMETATGVVLVSCSSIASELRIIESDTGNNIDTYVLDGGCRASPFVANSHVFVATEQGSLYAWQCDTNRAPSAPVSGFSPADNESITSATPVITWTAATDADAGDPANTLRYLVKVDDDGEVLESYDYVTTTDAGVVSLTLPMVITDDTKITYAIRTIDDELAYSGWSTLQSFWVKRASTTPEPPTNLRAVPGNGYVDLIWAPSPSQDVKGYLVSWKEQDGVFGTPVFAGEVLAYRVDSLTNGLLYTFRIIAEDYDSLQSTAVEITARPAYPIMVNDTPYATLANALANAASGDTISLGVGTFVIPYTLQIKQGVNIRGYSAYHTLLNGTGLDRIFLMIAGAGITSTISDFTLYGAQVGIDTAGYKTVVRNTIIRQCNIGILVGTGSQTEIINNTIVTNTAQGIRIAGADTYIRNNIIMDNQYGISCEAGITPAVSYNDVFGNSVADYDNCSAGIGDISMDVVFLDEPNHDYRIQIDQPSIDMGDPHDEYINEPHARGTRINLGAFGNTPYAAVTLGAFHIATTILSDGATNAYYNVLISTAGGSGPITWTVTAGSLPAGVNFDTTIGEIAGNIPLGNSGTYDFSAEVVDELGNLDSGDFTIIINQVSSNTLCIVTNILSNGEVRTFYRATISGANGFLPYTWSIAGGSLPPGLALNTVTGEIMGTPPYSSDGIHAFTVRLTDVDAFSVVKPFIIMINAGLASGSSGSDSGGGSKCFIATAAFGSALAPSVRILQRFRDEVMLSNRLGQWLVACYYYYSPPLARYIAQHNWARITTRVILIPAIVYSWFMVSTGWLGKILLCVLLMVGGIMILLRNHYLLLLGVRDKRHLK